MSLSPGKPRRLVHLAEGALDPKEAKTTFGVIRYGIHETVAIIDSTHAGSTFARETGIGNDAPIVADFKEALQYKPDCLLIGVAPRGGSLPPAWRSIILEAIQSGLDVYSGLHSFLSNDEELAAAAQGRGVRLWDVRKPPKGLPVALGQCRKAKSYINLTIGSDCSVGKMTTSLEIQRAARRRGVRAEFVATGQTGILISGWGHPIDAIPGDFMSGAVEKDCMMVDGQCEIILVEGQASLIHPGYSGVTLALLHGAMPDSVILCHQASRKEVARGYGIPFPHMLELARMHTEAVGWIKPSKCVAMAIATYDMSDAEAREALKFIAKETGLPTTDPVRFGAEPLLDAIEAHRKEIGK